MHHYMKLQPEPFEKLRSGRKTIELRLMDEKRKLIRVGDEIEFSNAQDRAQSFLTRVSELHSFESFAALYAALPKEKLGYEPGETADPRDMEVYYSAEEQARFGVVGIEVELADEGRATLTRLSKFISLILRHRPELAGIALDEHGWADADALIEGMNRTRRIDRAMLERIVAEDDKQRYAFSPDGQLIRANQGHSVPVDVEPEAAEPPEFLWHGTTNRAARSIDVQGLLRGSRLYVHLSADERTARNVGLRRQGGLTLYRVRALDMYRDGFAFYRAANGVWLTEAVPAVYLEKTYAEA